MALSVTYIAALKPKETRYTVSDGEGLTLEVLPSGSKSCRYRYRHNGKLEKVSLGQYPALSLKAARARQMEYSELREHGKSPARHKQEQKFVIAASITMFEFGERYFTEIVQRDRKDASGIRAYLDKEIYPYLAERPLKDVAASDVQSIVFRKRDGGHPAAAGQIRNLFKRIFDYAMANGLVMINPTTTLPMRFITQTRSRDRTLSPDEIRLYLGGLCGSNIRRQFKFALHIILLTLVRKGELLNARWEDINFEAAEWSFLRNSPRQVSLTSCISPAKQRSSSRSLRRWLVRRN